jgi:hypothetical protein
MANDWEDIFRNWGSSPSATEQTRCNNALGVIRRAVSQRPELAGQNINVFAQGSYRNHTNVRTDSDVDVCALKSNVFFYELPDGGRPEDFDVTPTNIDYSEYKKDVEDALVSYLGRNAVKRGNKALNIHETTYHVDADVVACFEYRLYLSNYSYLEGTSFLTDKGITIHNWPEQNYQNGVKKNEATQQRFKPIVRVMKNLRNEMEENGYNIAKVIPSYLIECLIWNVPNEGFGHNYYTDDARYSIAHIYNKTLKPEDCKDWCEVNDIKYLFHPTQRWQYQQVNQFMSVAWNYIGFK